MACAAGWALAAEPSASARWCERAYGLSLQPPAGAAILERAEDDTVPWSLAGPGSMELCLRDIEVRMRLDPIRDQLQAGQDPLDHQLLDAIGQQRTISPQGQARLLAHSTDDALVRMEGDIDYTIALYLRTLRNDWHVHQVAAAAIRQVGATWPSAVIAEERKIEIAGRPGALVYYRIPDLGHGAMALGQAFLGVAPRAYALLQFKAPQALFEPLRPTFEAVLASVQIEPAEALQERRRSSLERGEMWLGMLAPTSLREAVPPPGLLRLLRDRTDIGYMTVAIRPAAELGLAGLAVLVQARVLDGPYAYDTDSRFFLSEDLTHELWAIKATARLARDPGPARPKEPPTKLSWAENGMRADDRIEVTRQGHQTLVPTTQVWQRPGIYLSQVHLHLLESLVPADKPQELGFYAYVPSSNEIAFRAVEIQPQADGGYHVLTRVTPDRGQAVSAYDRDRRLQWRLLPGGRRIVPTTPEQFRELWGLEPGAGPAAQPVQGPRGQAPPPAR